MTSLLVRLFIKDKDNVGDLKVRTKYGNLGSITGIICNFLLFGLKFFAGTFSGSFSIVADAFNNLSDMGSSLMTFLGFKLAAKPADKDHPFGHGRMEYIAALVVSFLILLVGFELFKGSIEKIMTPEVPNADILTVVILVCSILIKLWMAIFNKKLGDRIDSDALRATSRDSLNDCISTATVLVSTVVLKIFGLNIDAYVGLAVSLFILYSGIKSVKETLDPLLGMPPEQKDVEAIREIVKTVPEYQGIHDLIVHNYGPGRVFCSLHIEVPQDTDILKCHESVDACEKEIFDRLGIEATIHTDPIAIGDPYCDELKEVFSKLIAEISDKLAFHDFRIVKGDAQTNVIFDIVLPTDVKMTADCLRAEICRLAKEYDKKLNCVITVDNDYINIKD